MKQKNRWFNYIIFEQYKTYVGSTVNLNRRIRQHNGEIKGGAKYTRGGDWEYYCVLYNLNNEKCKCLSEEWHLKHQTTKVKNYSNTYDRRRRAIERYIKPDAYEHKYILFVSKKYVKYLPKCNVGVYIWIIDDFSHENINELVSQFLIFRRNPIFIKSIPTRINNLLSIKYPHISF